MAQLESADLQKQIDEVFESGNDCVSHTFRDFDPRSVKPFREMMNKIIAASEQVKAKEGTAVSLTQLNTSKIESVINFAKTATKQGINSRLVKKAFATFLAHDKSAQQLGLFPSPLKDLSEFRIDQESSDAIQFMIHSTPMSLPWQPSTKGLPVRPASNPATADTLSGEDILRYWRDDYNLNDHHNHWHQVYPWKGIPKKDENGQYIKNADGSYVYTRTIERQGELFLYMHSQMLARYNADRITWNGLGLVDPFTYEQIVEPSYTPPPALRDKYGARPPLKGWLYTQPPSLPGSDEYPATTDNMTKWRNNINKAIIEGYFITTKKSSGGEVEHGKLILTKDNAMNWVGTVVEAQAPDLKETGDGFYIDEDLYGSVHNFGHDKFSMIGYQEYTGPTNNLGVMGFVEAAVRDPVFWMWHRHIDQFHESVVQKYKRTDLKEFAPEHVTISSVKILPSSDSSTTPSDGISTYLTAPQLDLHEVNAKLQHEPYKWEVEVETDLSEDDIASQPQSFTIRIFIVPRALLHQQHRWIEMDKFKHTLSKKKETVTRADTASSVARKPYVKGENVDSQCACGWPPNMMLPNGTAKGIDYVAFAMLTDKDELSEDSTQSISFCGAKDGEYPDKRGMGYPFDKSWYVNDDEFYAKIQGQENIKVNDFKIYSETRFFQGIRVPVGDKVTWDGTIKGSFTDNTKEYFLKQDNLNIDVTKKADVILYRMFIYGTIVGGSKPTDDYTLDPWTEQQRLQFIGWVQADYP